MTATHLDQEALSAALDGEATAAERGHLATCEDCRHGLDTVRAVAGAVAAPVTPRDPLATDAAIRAALGAADADLAQAGAGRAGAGLAEAGAGLAGAGAGLAGAGAGLAGAGAGRAEGGVPTSRGRGRAPGAGGRWPAARRWAVAAVLVAVLGGAGLLALAARGSGPGGPKSAVRANGVAPGVAAAPSTNASGRGVTPGLAGGAASAENGAETASPPLIVAGRPLGDQQDPAALTRLVDSQINGGGAAAAGPASSPQAGSIGVTPVCAAQGAAAAGLGDQSVLRYAAAVRWRGEDAIVLVYTRPGGGRAGVVMSLSACGLLITLPV